MIRRTVLGSAFAFAATLLLSATAQAQLFRAYLASDGNDANACTLVAPCRLLPAALTAVADGGEIWMLDSANYNTATVTIGKSVSILAVPGAVGSLVALGGGPALSITAASLKIALRNVVIGPVIGAMPGTNGVELVSASNLSIENSVIANLPGHGAYVTGSGTLNMTDTVVRNNSGAAIRLQETARAIIATSKLLGNIQGGVAVACDVPATIGQASISDSLIVGYSNGIGNGVVASTSTDATARVSVSRSTITRMSSALRASSSGGTGQSISQVHVTGSSIVENINSYNQAGTGSAIYSLGNNLYSGNTTSAGSLTPMVPQ